MSYDVGWYLVYGRGEWIGDGSDRRPRVAYTIVPDEATGWAVRWSVGLVTDGIFAAATRVLGGDWSDHPALALAVYYSPTHFIVVKILAWLSWVEDAGFHPWQLPDSATLSNLFEGAPLMTTRTEIITCQTQLRTLERL